MLNDKLKPADTPKPREPAKRFVQADDDRAIVMGKLKTDEEARLAAEIEKLRD